MLNKEQLIFLLKAVEFTMSEYKWRFGQTVFNCGVELYPGLFESIRGTNLDPFHNDDIVDNLFREKCNLDAYQWWLTVKS